MSLYRSSWQLFYPQNVGPVYVFPHKGRCSGTLSFCFGGRKIMKKLQEHQGRRNWLDKRSTSHVAAEAQGFMQRPELRFITRRQEKG